jgi:HPt (histidine-containing phosphotransfer) domain-containing protein
MSDNAQVQNPLNMEKLAETFMDNMDIVKQILLSFQDSFKAFEEEFLDAQYKGDTETMSRLAHGLKGSAGNIRAEALSAQAADLQTRIDKGDTLGGLVDEVIAGLAGLNQQINTIVEE